MSTDASIETQILRAIRRIIRRTSAYSRSVSRSGGISVPQTLCLKAIAVESESTEVSVAIVAQSVQLSVATVSRILDQLESAGLIRRERRVHDRRKVFLVLTEEGRQRLTDLPTPLHELFLKRLRAVEPEEQLQLLTALERIVELMDAGGIDASPVLTPELNVIAEDPD